MTDVAAVPTDGGRGVPAGTPARVVALAGAGACAGAIVVALLLLLGVFHAQVGGPRPPRADLLAWAAGDVVDDRVDFLVYHVGCALVAAASLVWCAVGARHSTGRRFLVVPPVALLLTCAAYMVSGAAGGHFVAAVGALACAVVLVQGRRAPRLPSADARTAALPSPSPFSWWDALVIAVVVLVLFERRPEALTAAILREDHFFHWDVYAMGPAVASRCGWTPGAQTPLTYGFGPGPVLGQLAEWTGGLTHAHMVRVAGWVEIGYVLTLYAALRVLGMRTATAALTLAAGVSFERFRLVAYAPHDLMRYPSSSVLRFLCDAPWLLLVAIHERTGRRAALVGAGAVAAAAVAWTTDTGLYLLMAQIVYVGTVAWRDRPAGRPVVGTVGTVGTVVAGVAPMVFAAVAVAAALGGNLAPALSSVSEQIALRTSGYAAFLVPPFDVRSAAAYAAPVMFVVLGVAAIAMRSRGAAVCAAWSVYALGAYHYYVGRSIAYNWFRLAIVGAVAVSLLARLARRTDSEDSVRRSLGAFPRVRRFGPAVLAVLVLAATPRIPARVLATFRSAPAVVRADPEIVVPAGTDAAVAAAIGEGIRAIRAESPDGVSAAVISDYEVLYCLGAAQRPFSPCFPLLHMTLTVAQLDDARRRLDDPAISVVFIDTGRPRYHWSRELIPALREHVAKSFERDGRRGDLEVWRRRRDR